MVIYISNDEMEKCKKIVVVGSTNVDLIARVSHLPEPGETIGDAEYCLSYGGKELTRQLLLPGQEDMSHLFLVWEMMPMQIHL